MQSTSLLLQKDEDGYGSPVHGHCENTIGDRHYEQTISTHVKDMYDMSAFDICAILSTAFSYGCIMSTLYLLTLPVECERISDHDGNGASSGGVNKSLVLAMFAGLGGIAQLITPLTGKLSDSCEFVTMDYNNYDNCEEMRNHRMPYLILGSMCMLIGLMGQAFGSLFEIWGFYTIFFSIHMIGINVVYCIMIALIPDLVPQSQTGLANGTLALLLVMGSLFGFAIFHLFSTTTKNSSTATMEHMYGLYIFVTIATTVLTYKYATHRQMFIYKIQLQSNREDKVNNENSNVSSTTHQKNKNYEQQSLCHIFYMLLVKPLEHTSWSEILGAYTIDPKIYHDFFIVTVSRLFYYMAISSQTFFLYFVHDRIIATSGDNNENDSDSSLAIVSTLAIVGQVTGALTCYPVGIISDKFYNGVRKPFVYISCVILASSYIAIISCKTYHQMMICIMIAGAANGIYLTMDTSLAVDTLPASTLQKIPDTMDPTVKESQQFPSYQQQFSMPEQQQQQQMHDDDGSAQLLGVWGVAGFLGTTLGPLIFAPALLIFGYIQPKTPNHNFHHHFHNHETHDPYYKLEGYAVLYSISAFFFLCSAVTLTFVQKKGV